MCFQLVRLVLPLALARTLVFDNALQRLSFAGFWSFNSAKDWVGRSKMNADLKSEKKKKSRRSLIYRTLSLGASGWA